MSCVYLSKITPMNPLKVGDKVRVVDEAIEGFVSAINGNVCEVNVDGMNLPFMLKELVVIVHDDLVIPSISKQITPKDKQVESDAKKKLSGLEASSEATYELDLHIHELLDRYAHMSNGEILQYQMTKCRAFVREAIDKRYPRVVLIHGVGEGVLRAEIHRYLEQLDHVSFHDAPYRIYGYGATEVIIHR